MMNTSKCIDMNWNDMVNPLPTVDNDNDDDNDDNDDDDDDDDECYL